MEKYGAYRACLPAVYAVFGVRVAENGSQNLRFNPQHPHLPYDFPPLASVSYYIPPLNPLINPSQGSNLSDRANPHSIYPYPKFKIPKYAWHMNIWFFVAYILEDFVS